MDIKGKVYCFFEQSGVFKNEFRKLGYEAFDYDIQNNFGETDHQIDLFAEIEKAYMGGVSVFDSISYNDLIIAFFPCIYFEAMQANYYQMKTNNLYSMPKERQYSTVIDRIAQRERYYTLLYKLFAVCDIRGLRLIVENPATQPHYLFHPANFIPPSIIDKNRTIRGDYFKKPTAYWYVNCQPTYGYSIQINDDSKRVQDCKRGKGKGLCSEERSMISPDYARNFICDFILGKDQEFSQKSLFDF